MYLGGWLVGCAAGGGQVSARGQGDGGRVFDRVTGAAVAAPGQIERSAQSVPERDEKLVEMREIVGQEGVVTGVAGLSCFGAAGSGAAGPVVFRRVARRVLFSADSRHAVHPGRRLASEKQNAGQRLL